MLLHSCAYPLFRMTSRQSTRKISSSSDFLSSDLQPTSSKQRKMDQSGSNEKPAEHLTAMETDNTELEAPAVSEQNNSVQDNLKKSKHLKYILLDNDLQHFQHRNWLPTNVVNSIQIANVHCWSKLIRSRMPPVNREGSSEKLWWA